MSPYGPCGSGRTLLFYITVTIIIIVVVVVTEVTVNTVNTVNK